MKKAIFTIALAVLISISCKAQLSEDMYSEETVFGLTLSRTSIGNSSVDASNPKRNYDPYISIGIDMIHHAYEKGQFRFFISSKVLTTDLIHSIVNLIEDTSREGEVNMTGFLWSKFGYNVFATDNLCIGVGASFSDYIIDLPKWRPTINIANAIYEEPTGYHLTAGPSLFLDYAIGSIVINSISSYNLGFAYYPIKSEATGDRSIDTIENYDTPHFFSTGLYVNHTNTGLYLSLEYTKMIDNGIIQNNLSRKEIAIGWIMDFSIF